MSVTFDLSLCLVNFVCNGVWWNIKQNCVWWNTKQIYNSQRSQPSTQFLLQIPGNTEGGINSSDIFINNSDMYNTSLLSAPQIYALAEELSKVHPIPLRPVPVRSNICQPSHLCISNICCVFLTLCIPNVKQLLFRRKRLIIEIRYINITFFNMIQCDGKIYIHSLLISK